MSVSQRSNLLPFFVVLSLVASLTAYYLQEENQLLRNSNQFLEDRIKASSETECPCLEDGYDATC